MQMAVLKTGHYLVLGMVGAAHIAGTEAETISTLQELGNNMGPAFQIRDDLQEIVPLVESHLS